MTFEIIEARTPEQLTAIREMLVEYEQYLGVNLDFQGFEEELESLPGKYAPPYGVLLMAVKGHAAAGCIALRPIGEGVCEVKRFFVRPAFRKMGIGESLLRLACGKAKKMGYASLWLDSLKRLKEADQLYKKFGFSPIPPYNENQEKDVYYLELDLTSLPNDYASS